MKPMTRLFDAGRNDGLFWETADSLRDGAGFNVSGVSDRHDGPVG